MSVIWPVVVANFTEQHKHSEYCLQWVAFEEGSSLSWIRTLAMVRVYFTAFFESCFPVRGEKRILNEINANSKGTDSKVLAFLETFFPNKTCTESEL